MGTDMEKDVMQLIDMLYRMIDEAKSAPFSGDKCMLVRDEALDLIEDIRNQLPTELKRSKELIDNYNDFIQKAHGEAERIINNAKADAASRTSENQVTIAARQKGQEIVRRAEERSREMYRVANEYTEDALRRTAEAIRAAMDELEQSRVRFRAASAEQMQRRREELTRLTNKTDKSEE